MKITGKKQLTLKKRHIKNGYAVQQSQMKQKEIQMRIDRKKTRTH